MPLKPHLIEKLTLALYEMILEVEEYEKEASQDDRNKT
jgi:hypothetical protein